MSPPIGLNLMAVPHGIYSSHRPPVTDSGIVDLPSHNLRGHQICFLPLRGHFNHPLTAGSTGSLLGPNPAHTGRDNRDIPVPLVVPHADIGENDTDPVEIVSQHRTIGSRVGPSEQSVEYTPSATTTQFRVAAVDVPDTLTNIIRTGPRSRLRSISTDDVVPSVVLEVPDGARKQPSGNKIKEARRDDQEVLQGGSVTTPGGAVSLVSHIG